MNEHKTNGRGVYCTIVARNYFPQALALHESIRSNEPERELVVLIVDGPQPGSVEARRSLRVLDMEALGLSRRHVFELAAIYDVVELSTALKPLLLKRLLSEFEQVVYLDPDTYVVSPLDELEPLIDEHAIVLTPHFLQPIPPGTGLLSEMHSLNLGVHNLGFCAVGRRALPFLAWWWSHLERECLIYPLLGLFVDQKWTDVGSVMFGAYSLPHFGYNVGPWNLHERRFARIGAEYVMESSGEPLRLLHFSGFNPVDPESISARLSVPLKNKRLASTAYLQLSHEYARVMLRFQAELGPAAAYAFDRDQSGRRLTTRVRRTYRRDLLVHGSGTLPSPFVAAERGAFARWRAASYRRQLSGTATDAAIAFKYAFPDVYRRMRKQLPSSFVRVRGRLLNQALIRR